MSVRLYMDVNVHAAITEGLRHRGVDVRTAQEDGCGRLPDDLLLDRATSLGRVLFTCDDDLLAEAARRQRDGVCYCGVVFIRQLAVSIGRCIEDLELVSFAGESEDFANRVIYLPLR